MPQDVMLSVYKVYLTDDGSNGIFLYKYKLNEGNIMI